MNSSESAAQSPLQTLEKAIEGGLTFGECVRAFAARNPKEHLTLIEQARGLYEVEGSVEFDDVSIVSEGESGAYALSWVWVDGITEEET